MTVTIPARFVRVALLAAAFMAGCHHAVVKPARVIAATAPSASSMLETDQALPPGFEPSSWRFVQADGMKTDGLPVTERPTLDFLQGTLGGGTGCNRLLGDYQLAGTAITLSNIAATRRYCDGRMALESTILSVLGRTRYVVLIRSSGLLGLVDGDRRLMAELERVNDSAPGTSP